MLFKDALGEVLRETRLSRGMVLRDLSDKGFIALGYLSEVERGKKEISSEFLEIVAHALGFEPHSLIIEAGFRMAGHTIPDTPEALDEYADLVVS
jgi:transcriptional regulator with XRE-family HTH domain